MLKTVGRTALVLVATPGFGLAVNAPTSAEAATCPQTPTNPLNSVASFTGDGVNIRTGPSTSCTSKGLGYRIHSVTYHCEASGWVYLTDNTTGVTGWSSGQFVTSTDAARVCR
jgi:uncharacterized protein YraI